MRLSRLQWVVVLATLVGLGAVGLKELPPLLNRSLNHYQQAAYIKLGNYPVAGEALYSSLEPFDYGCFTMGWWEQPQCSGLRQGAQAKNPRFNAGSYLTVFALADWMAPAPDSTIVGDWYRTMLPFAAMTTQGDTARIYPHAWVVNYLMPGAIDAAKEVWTRHLAKQAARDVQWLMLDFCSAPLPDMLPPTYDRSQQLGLMDLDGDGFDHWHDPDEVAAWRQANIDLMRALRQIRPDVFLIPNGALAIQDAEFRHEVHGCYIEGFPQWFFGGAWRYDNAMSATYPHGIPSLVKMGEFLAAPGYVMVEDTYNTGTPGYLSALFDGVIEMRRSQNDTSEPPRPLDLRRLGAPKGPATFDQGRITRLFDHGAVSLTVNSERMVTPAVTE